MKVIIFSGDDFNTLEKEYLSYLSDLDQSIKRILITEVEDPALVFSSDLLFPEKRVYIIDNNKLFTPKTIDYLNENYKKIEDDIIIYSNGVFPATVKSKFKFKVEEKTFMLPKLIFNLLDLFFTKKEKELVSLYGKVKDMYPTELLVYFISNHLVELALVASNVSDFPSWKEGKLKKQLSYTNLNELKKHINAIAQIDYKLKTGKADITALDLFILRNLL